MPAPSTIDEFLELVRKSGVVDLARVQAYVDRLRENNELPAEPIKFASLLIRDGHITHFQAEQFLQGKWRRFTIGKYKVLEKLGAGGMGSVYLCEHMLMRRRVAVKVLPAKSDDSSSLDRFYREARAVAALDHPNIVRAYDIDQDENLHFLVMEHVDGSSLQEIIKKTGPMDVLRAAHYIRQSALGLQHAHESQTLVHRDIKPGNILVDRNGIVKVLDMGLARFFLDESDDLTKKYDENVLGTADYLAPEQALDSHTADIRADIYSLGGTFYFCLTGRPPFAEGSVAQKLIWHQTRQPRPIHATRPEVPAEIVAIIDKMMAKDRNARYQTPLEVADALAPWTQTPIPPPPESEMPQFSLAAKLSSQGTETGASSASRSPSDSPVVPAPQPRKVWQVASAPPSPRPTQAAISTPPPTSAPTAPAPAVRAPAPPRSEARSAPPPPSSNNGQTKKAPKVIRTPAVVIEDDPVPEEALPADDFDLRVDEARAKSRDPLAHLDQRKMRRWLLIGGAVLVPVTGLLIFLLMGSGGRRGKDTREPIRVTSGPSAMFYALRRAKEGDRIIVSGDINECNCAINTRNLTIEAEPGKRVVWKCPPDAPSGSKLLIVNSAAGLHLKGITLDGGDKTDYLVTLYGTCPGLKLEQVEFKNIKKYGLLITTCEGSSDSPVELNDVLFRTTRPDQTAVRFELQRHVKVKLNRFFNFKNCTFEGPGKKITVADPSVVDASTLTLPANLILERVQ
jgi:serine/threonine protein kinase